MDTKAYERVLSRLDSIVQECERKNSNLDLLLSKAFFRELGLLPVSICEKVEYLTEERKSLLRLIYVLIEKNREMRKSSPIRTREGVKKKTVFNSDVGVIQDSVGLNSTQASEKNTERKELKNSLIARGINKTRLSVPRSTSLLKEVKSNTHTRNRHQATTSMVSSFEIPAELLKTEQPRTSIPSPFSQTTRTFPQKNASESQTICILEFSPDIGVCSVLFNQEEVVSSVEQFKKIVQKVSNHPQSIARTQKKSVCRKPEIKTITLLEEEVEESDSSQNISNPLPDQFYDSLACQSREESMNSGKFPALSGSQRLKQKCTIHIDTPSFGGLPNGFRFQSQCI